MLSTFEAEKSSATAGLIGRRCWVTNRTACCWVTPPPAPSNRRTYPQRAPGAVKTASSAVLCVLVAVNAHSGSFGGREEVAMSHVCSRGALPPPQLPDNNLSTPGRPAHAAHTLLQAQRRFATRWSCTK